MQVCAWMYLFKNYAVKGWVGFTEVYGMPLRVGKRTGGQAGLTVRRLSRQRARSGPCSFVSSF